MSGIHEPEPFDLGDLPRHLLYATHAETEVLMFAPRDLALSIFEARREVQRCKSWGEARRRLPPPWFADLKDRERAPARGEPADGEALDGRAVGSNDEPWPLLRYGEMESWLPSWAGRYGEQYSTMLSSGLNLPASAKRTLLRTLRQVGIECTYDRRVPSLFSVWD